jgi:CBS domain-containing protein
MRIAAAGVSLTVLGQAAFAASAEDTMSAVTLLMFYGSIAFAIAVFVGVYFLRPQDKRLAPLSTVFAAGGPVHGVAPDTTVADCARQMTARNIGALIVLDGPAVKGIFTERDALTRVLAAGLDPTRVKVSEVMTSDPTSVTPATTVDAAMALITRRRFRHLPVVQDGRLLAVVSSGDLTRWLVKDQGGEVHELVELAAQD